MSDAARRLVLLNPGPVNVSEAVRAAMAGPDWCHREPEALELVADVRARLLRTLGADPSAYAAVLLAGSGTAAVEAMVASLVPQGRALLVVRNGVYGERIEAMARAHGIDTVVVGAPWLARPHPRQVERALALHPEVGAVALVHHETTTGLLNDAAAIGVLAGARGVPLLLDSVSGLGGEPLDLAACNVAAAAGTANKCLQGMPGVSFVLARRELLEAAGRGRARSLYLDLTGYFRLQERRDTPFTMPLQVLMALRQALAELERETVAGRAARYRARAEQVRAGVQALGLGLPLPPVLRSSSITLVRLPEAIGYDRLHDALREEGFVIYAGQGPLRQGCFRIANMGEVGGDDIAGFLHALARLLGPGAPA